jgi:transcription initiation factor TFIIH subunit 3
MVVVINRLAHPSSGSLTDETSTSASADPHILILSVSPDLSSSYIPVMNSIFSAQKLVRVVKSDRVIQDSLLLYGYQKVSIDVCKVFGEETVFLQQAAHLTGGSYIYLERRDALLQYLTVCSPRP